MIAIDWIDRFNGQRLKWTISHIIFHPFDNHFFIFIQRYSIAHQPKYRSANTAATVIETIRLRFRCVSVLTLSTSYDFMFCVDFRFDSNIFLCVCVCGCYCCSPILLVNNVLPKLFRTKANVMYLLVPYLFRCVSLSFSVSAICTNESSVVVNVLQNIFQMFLAYDSLVCMCIWFEGN